MTKCEDAVNDIVLVWFLVKSELYTVGDIVLGIRCC